MKTICIQNCTDFKDSMFKVYINGEEHILRNKFLNVDIVDDASLEIKAKYNWDSSPAYTFEPKDDMSLQVTMNRRMMTNRLIWLLFSFVLAFSLAYFFGNGRFISFLPCILLLLPLIYQTIRRKKYFVVQEANKNA